MSNCVSEWLGMLQSGAGYHTQTDNANEFWNIINITRHFTIPHIMAISVIYIEKSNFNTDLLMFNSQLQLPESGWMAKYTYHYIL